MKDRLIGFGCSLTYGEGLPDCWDPKEKIRGATPSNLSWPTLVSNELNKDCINLGSCGASNKEIWHRIVNTDYQKNDIVIILWTYVVRGCILKNDNQIIRFHPRRAKRYPGISTEEIECNRLYYKKFYDDYNHNVENLVYINQAKQYLDSIGVKNYHFCFDDKRIDNSTVWHEFKNKCKWNNVQFNHLPYEKIDLGIDRDHPGVESQKQFSINILKVI